MHKNQYAGVSPLSAEVAISWTVSLGKSLMALRSPQWAVKLPDLSVRNIPCSPFLSVSLKKRGGRTTGCCARASSWLSSAEDAAFPALGCGFGARWSPAGGRKGALGGLVSVHGECGCQTAPPDNSGWAKLFQCICGEHCGQSSGEVTDDFPSSSYRWVLIINRSVGIP